MRKLFNILHIILLISIFMATGILAQGQKYQGPEDGAGDPYLVRQGYMSGNAVGCQFKNTTQLSDWGQGTYEFASKWPYDYSGSKMTDGVALLIGARVYVIKNADGVDSVVVDDMVSIQSLSAEGKLDTIYFLQTNYREHEDEDTIEEVKWSFYPPSGYLNLSDPDKPPAMSDDSLSWPRAGWPARGFEKKWQGKWNGRFGEGIIKADQECFFVVNDAHDQEYLQDDADVKYYPRPGVFIGDFVAVQKQNGRPWGGIGVRVEQRGYQWNNPQSRDAIFWEYGIANISDYDLAEVAFGYWMDNNIGGSAASDDGNDEIAAYDLKLDLAYSWDDDGFGLRNLRVGTNGFAYLESPANSTDGKDNDQDGVIDEKRDNKVQPGETKVGPTVGIANVQNFLDWNHLQMSDLKEHFAADEDQDWQDWDDSNGNGVYDKGENVGDDVGTDGVSPSDLDYEGPDANGTECNHIPDFEEGTGCEPNFAFTDRNESDMLGLTSFRLMDVPPDAPPYTHWFINDKSMWELVGMDSLVLVYSKPVNLAEVFATGVFPLYQGQTERISMSELHSWDEGARINPATNPPTSLFRLKEIVQVIYEKDYQFAQPPVMPTLTATPGDGFVALTWDNIAEIYTRDSFNKNINDFEGYKLYRATDRYFTDAKQMTDGFGNPTASMIPLEQWDMKDHITDFANFGLINGVAFYLGEDSGIAHYYIDRDVQNGRTYYYAITAYDFGMEEANISPTENNVIVKINENSEEITFISKNVAIVTPHPAAAGYSSKMTYSLSDSNVLGTGTIEPEVISANALKKDAKYRVAFDVKKIKENKFITGACNYFNTGIKVWEETNNKLNLVYEENPANFFSLLDTSETLKSYYIIPTDSDSVVTDIFSGIQLHIKIPVIEPQFDDAKSDWLTGTAPMTITTTKEDSKLLPWDYDIVFTADSLAYYSDLPINKMTITDENASTISKGTLLSKQNFSFYVDNTSILDPETNGPTRMQLVVQDLNNTKKFEMIGDRILVGNMDKLQRWVGTAFIIDFREAASDAELPKPGDVYQVRFKRPFWVTDTLSFSVKVEESFSGERLEQTIKRVKVVPNPYIATNVLEPALANPYFNQRRRIMFTHVPAQCTIKIFSVSGVFIDEIEVNNDKNDGCAYWDLLTKEGIELAAGMYIYHLKAVKTNDEVMGKFAVIK